MALQPNIAEALQEFHRIAAEVPLWPGFHPETTPLVIHTTATAWLVGHPAPPAGYEALGSICGRTLHTGPRQPEMVANTSAEINGVLCALAVLPDAAEPADGFARLLLHESFHVFQHQGLPAVQGADWRMMALYPENDPANNAMAIVENRQLLAALNGDAAAPARFLAVRLARQEQLDKKMSVYEVQQEYTEGTTTYIELRAGRPVAEIFPFLEQCNVGGKWAGNARFYFTGGAITLLLDRLAPGWHQRLAAGDATLQGLLLDAVGADLPPVEAVLEGAGYAEILQAEHRREAERRARIDEMLAQLESGPGCRVEIEIGKAPGCTWSPMAVIGVRPGVRLHPQFFGATGPEIRIRMDRLCLEDRERQVAVIRLPEPPTVVGEAPFRFEGPGLQGTAPAGRIEAVGDGWRICIGG